MGKSSSESQFLCMKKEKRKYIGFNTKHTQGGREINTFFKDSDVRLGKVEVAALIISQKHT